MFALLIVSVAAGLAYAFSRRQPARLAPRASADRPTLLLLTSLPLVFAEQFSIEGGGSPALKALETRYRVVPISVADDAELGKGRLLLMAQPRAQPAEDLVALDKWVRGGGRVLLLADPMLEWPSTRPLGDPFRPPPMFADTGLLAHWGLKLDAPDERRPEARPARRLRHIDRFAGVAVRRLRDQRRPPRRALPARSRPRDDRCRRGLPRRRETGQTGPGTTSMPCSANLRGSSGSDSFPSCAKSQTYPQTRPREQFGNGSGREACKNRGNPRFRAKSHENP